MERRRIGGVREQFASRGGRVNENDRKCTMGENRLNESVSVETPRRVADKRSRKYAQPGRRHRLGAERIWRFEATVRRAAKLTGRSHGRNWRRKTWRFEATEYAAMKFGKPKPPGRHGDLTSRSHQSLRWGGLEGRQQTALAGGCGGAECGAERGAEPSQRFAIEGVAAVGRCGIFPGGYEEKHASDIYITSLHHLFLADARDRDAGKRAAGSACCPGRARSSGGASCSSRTSGTSGTGRTSRAERGAAAHLSA